MGGQAEEAADEVGQQELGQVKLCGLVRRAELCSRWAKTRCKGEMKSKVAGSRATSSVSGKSRGASRAEQSKEEVEKNPDCFR